MRIPLSTLVLSMICCTAALADDAPRGVPAERKAPDQPAAREERGDRRPADPNERPAEPRKRGDPKAAGAFEQVTGLTDEQRTKFIDIRRKYEQLMYKEREEMMAVLTDAQREEFTIIVTRGRRSIIPRAEAGGDNPREARREGVKEGDRPAVKENRRDGAPDAGRGGELEIKREGAPDAGREGARDVKRDAAPAAGREGAKENRRDAAPGAGREGAQEIRRDAAPGAGREGAQGIKRDAAPGAGREGTPEIKRDGALDAGRGSVKEALAPSVQATITKLEVPKIWIQSGTAGAAPAVVTADEKTVITLDGKSSTFAELKVGQQVTLQHSGGVASKIDAHSAAAPAPAK